MYAKIKDDERDDKNWKLWYLLGIIESNPGIHFSKIKRIAKLANGTLVYNLSKLESDNLVFTKIDKNRRRYYMTGQIPGEFWYDNLLEKKKMIVDCIYHNQPVTKRDIAKSTNFSNQLINHYLKELELDEHRVIRRGIRRYSKTIYELTPETREDIFNSINRK